MRISPILPLLMLATATLTACAHNTDSVAKLNAIPFGDVNESNIATMVVNPADLVRGHGQDQVDGTTCIFDVEKIASRVPLAVDRQFFAKKHTGNETRHHFLQMLHRSKVIEWPNDDGGNPICRPI